MYSFRLGAELSYKPGTRTHLHFGGQKQARRSHEKTFVLVERVQHVKLVEEDQSRGDRVDRPALIKAKTQQLIMQHTRGGEGKRLRAASKV